MQKRGDSMNYNKRCPACKTFFDVDSKSKKVTCPNCHEELTLFIPTTERRRSVYTGGFCLKYIPSKMKCTKCGKTKPISEFKYDSTQARYHQATCKYCSNKQYRKYYEAYKQHKLQKEPELPEINPRAPLSSVLKHLIRVSKRKYNADEILNNQINIIKETITGEIEA